MKKPVNLSNGMSFPQVSIAQSFFREILRSEAPGAAISVEDSLALETLYRDYCSATSWPITQEISGFSRGIETRKSVSSTIITSCFIVHFQDGTELPFSFKRACSAIASSCR